MTDIALLLAGGTIVDGTGAAGRPGSVAVEGDRIRLFAPGEAPEHVGRRIDATGLVVAPGFIDVHSHAGLMILAEPHHEAKVRQGITTEVVGVDGLSYAPFDRLEDLNDLVRMNAGFDGRPDEHVRFDWSTVADYLDRFDGHVSVNIAVLAGNAALRIGALGWANVAADARAIDRQRAILRDGLGDGAYGLSTGLDYPPSAYATTDELVALAEETGRFGGIYHTHVRYPLGDRFLDPFREAIEIGRRGGIPAHLTHFYHLKYMSGTPAELLALVDDAQAEGLDVTFDAYPYEWASTTLLVLMPLWVQEGGPDRTKDRLADRRVRERVKQQLAAGGKVFTGSAGIRDVRIGNLRLSENGRWESRTLGEYLDAIGGDPVDAIADLILSEDLRTNMIVPGPHLDGIRTFLRHPSGMVGSDAILIADKPSPRTYGTFPRILGQFVRDEGLIGLEEAVRRMTSAAAERFGFRDRGVLRDGAIADITVFDPALVRANATYDEPRRFPDGIDFVIVNGTVVVDDGRHTGATPGRSLRRGRD